MSHLTPAAGELAGRVALVTGANHGIGAATARALAERGAAVLISYLRLGEEAAEPGQLPAYLTARAAGAETVVEAIRAAGGRAEAVEADLSDPGTPARLLDEAEARLGPVSILVNNASGWRQDTFAAEQLDRFGRRMAPVTAASFAAQFLVDGRAGALLIAELARRHVAAGRTWGRIVSLTSGGAEGFPSEVSYGAAKAALTSYTLSAASELGRYGITANVVHPPVTDTGWITPQVREAAEASSPLRRVAAPEVPAGVIALLCGEAAGAITGNVVQVH